MITNTEELIEELENSIDKFVVAIEKKHEDYSFDESKRNKILKKKDKLDRLLNDANLNYNLIDFGKIQRVKNDFEKIRISLWKNIHFIDSGHLGKENSDGRRKIVQNNKKDYYMIFTKILGDLISHIRDSQSDSDLKSMNIIIKDADYSIPNTDIKFNTKTGNIIIGNKLLSLLDLPESINEHRRKGVGKILFYMAYNNTNQIEMLGNTRKAFSVYKEKFGGSSTNITDFTDYIPEINKALVCWGSKHSLNKEGKFS